MNGQIFLTHNVTVVRRLFILEVSFDAKINYMSASKDPYRKVLVWCSWKGGYDSRFTTVTPCKLVSEHSHSTPSIIIYLCNHLKTHFQFKKISNPIESFSHAYFKYFYFYKNYKVSSDVLILIIMIKYIFVLNCIFQSFWIFGIFVRFFVRNNACPIPRIWVFVQNSRIGVKLFLSCFDLSRSFNEILSKSSENNSPFN